MGGGAVAAPALIYSTLYTRQVFKKQNKTKHDFAQMEGKDTLYVCLLSWPDGLPGQSAMDYRFFILPGILYLYCPVYCHDGLHVCFFTLFTLCLSVTLCHFLIENYFPNCLCGFEGL